MTTKMPEWMEGIREESLDKAVKAGEILPQLPLPTIAPGKTNSDETLYIKFVSLPRKVTGDAIPRGEMWVAAVEHQGAKKSLIIPDSLRFNLAKELRLNNMDSPVGQWFVIGAHLQETQYGKNTKLYWCQHKTRQIDEASSPQENVEVFRESFDSHSSSKPANPQEYGISTFKVSPNPARPARLSNPSYPSMIDEFMDNFQIKRDAEEFKHVDIPLNTANLDRKAILGMLRSKNREFTRDDMTNELRSIGITKEQVDYEWSYWKNIGILWECSPGRFKLV